MWLKTTRQFREVYDLGRKVVGDYAVVFYETPEAVGTRTRTDPCFGIVASKRVGGAIARNRAKRLLRVAARHYSGKLNHRNIWVVLVARASIDGKAADEVVEDVGRSLARARLLPG